MVTDPKYRTWFYRVSAPIIFFLAATVLVILVEQGLSDSATTTVTNSGPTVSTPETGSNGGTTTGKKKKKKVYRVQVGDTLESIAAKFHTTVDDLLALNPGIDPLALSPGQKIRVA